MKDWMDNWGDYWTDGSITDYFGGWMDIRIFGWIVVGWLAGWKMDGWVNWRD